MIKKLTLKFIIISALSILFVLILTIGSINIYNYVQMRNDIDSSLTLIITEPDHKGEPLPPLERPEDNQIQREMYFLVTFDENGEITSSRFDRIFIITEEEGLNLAKEKYDSSSYSGQIDNLFYKRIDFETSSSIAFIDAKNKLDSFNEFLKSSLIISSISYLVLVALIAFVSKLVFKVNEDAYQKQKQFITNASHELKTPLTVISADLELVEIESGKSEWTASIKDQVKRLTNMTNQLVILSKLDEQDLNKYPLSEINISNIVSDCVESFSPAFNKEKLNLVSNIQDNIIVNGNGYLLDELMFIFMDNALKYTKKNGTVRVELSLDNKNHPTLVFANDIPSDSEIDTSLLFERFYRGNNEKKDGSGIGLSIAKEIINLHHMDIKVNKKDNILEFVIRL